MEDGFSFDLSAAEWRRGIADEKAFVEALATRFEQALPEKTTVRREHSLFSKTQRVERIEITFATTEYILEFAPKRGITTTRAKVVRGIRLKTEEIPFAAWLDELSGTIREFAEENEELRNHLERFLLS